MTTAVVICSTSRIAFARDQSGVLALHDASVPALPFSRITDRPAPELGLTEGARFGVGATTILVRGRTLTAQPVELAPLTALGSSAAGLVTMVDRVGVVATRWPAIGPMVIALERALIGDSEPGFAVVQCLGRGEGLTPAGDDILVGALALSATLAHDSPIHRRSAAIATRAVAQVAKTTLVSEGLLQAAARGAFAPAVQAVLAATDPASMQEAIVALLELGATSGADTLVGVRTAAAAAIRKVGIRQGH